VCKYGHALSLLLGASDDLKRVSEVAYTQVQEKNHPCLWYGLVVSSSVLYGVTSESLNVCLLLFGQNRFFILLLKPAMKVC
jgi:hypothetical protein